MKRLKRGATLILCMALVCTFTIPVFAGNGFMNGGTFINNTGATFNNQGAFDNYSEGADTLINNGSFTGSGAVRLFTNQTFTGSGTFSRPPSRYYTLTFDYATTGYGIESQTVISGGYAMKPTDPTKAGCTFDGWYSDESLTTLYDFAATPVTNDITLYAKWLEVRTETVFVTDSSVSISGGKLLEAIEIDGTSRTLAYIGSDQSFTSARWYEMEVDSNNEIHSATLVPTQGRSMQSATLNSDAATISSDGSIYTCSDSTVFLVTTAASGKVTTPPDNVYTGIGTVSITPSADSVDSANMFFVYSGTTVQYAVILGTSTTTSGTGGSTTYTVTLPQTVISNTIESVTYTVQGVTGTYNSVSTSGTNNVYTVDANGLFKFTVTLNGTSYAMGPYTTAMINYNGTTGETVGVAERNNDWSALTCSITADENKSGLGLDEDLYQRITGTQNLTGDMGKVYIATGGTLNWTSSVNASQAQIYNYGTMVIGTEDGTTATQATFYGTLNNYGQVTNANTSTLYVGQTGDIGFVDSYGTLTNNGIIRVVNGRVVGNTLVGSGNIYSGSTGTTAYTVAGMPAPTSGGGGFFYAISQDTSASNTWQFVGRGTAASYRVSVNSDTITAGEVYDLADDLLTTGVTDDYKATLFTGDSYYTKTTITVKAYDATNGLLTPDGGDGNFYKVSDTSSIYDVSGATGTTMGAPITTLSAGDQLTVIYYVDSSDNSRVISDAWLTARGT